MTDTFKCTSDAPYDRHNYEVVLTNGKKIFFENWEEAQVYWWSNCRFLNLLDCVIVKDKKKVKSKGFG